MPFHDYHLKRATQRSAFTLLEVVVVMLIAGILIGSSLLLLSGPNEEQKIRSEHGKIEDLVRQGRALTTSYQQTLVLEFTEGQVSLAPLAMPRERETFDYFGEQKSSSSLRPIEELDWPRVVEIDPVYELSIRRWGVNGFSVIEEKQKERIYLQPNGMFEPLSVLLSKDFGDNSLSRIYHPLTGLAEDESLTITGTE